MPVPVPLTTAEATARCQDLKSYVHFGPDDETRLRAMKPRVAPHFESLAHAFYARAQQHPDCARVLDGGEAQLAQLRGTLVAWMDSTFSGPWDAPWLEQRRRIGHRHLRVELPQHFMFTGMNLIRLRLQEALLQSAGEDRTALALDVASLSRVLDMELAVMLDAYRDEMLQRALRTERLALLSDLAVAIGQDLRNPLSVIASSLHLLRNATTDARVERHLERMDRQLGRCSAVITAMLDMVQERPARRQPTALSGLVTTARESALRGTHTTLQLDLPDNLPFLQVDPQQVTQILVNLLTNAVEAAGEDVTIALRAHAQDGMAVITVNDNGPGLHPDLRHRLFEPLATTRANGVGLGLALCRKYAQHNGGSIEPTTGALPGAAFLVRLPLYAPA